MCACEIQCAYAFKRRYIVMAAFSTKKSGYCAFAAAACTSAHLGLILDTVILAVSIFVVLILGILLKLQ